MPSNPIDSLSESMRVIQHAGTVLHIFLQIGRPPFSAICLQPAGILASL